MKIKKIYLQILKKSNQYKTRNLKNLIYIIKNSINTNRSSLFLNLTKKI
jgi:hypothetical protein